AEVGILEKLVTGVQTCALPILGAYWHVKRRLEPRLPKQLTLGYVGRPERASPSEGYAIAHEAQEERIVQAVLARKPDAAGPTARSEERRVGKWESSEWGREMSR